MDNTTTQPFIAHVGLGYWGKNILRNLYELNLLHTACDTDRSILSERMEKFPEVKRTASLEDILPNPDIKAITIATPAVTHYELAKKALLSGKDVFVEKPLALNVKEGEELIRVAKDAGKILMVGHILQYHPGVIKLKELISSGELGKIHYIYSNRLSIGKLRTEENILWSFAPHDISVILMLLGEEPVKVSADGGAYLNTNIYDTTLTTLEFQNGVKGHIFVSWLHPFKEQKLIVVGSRAMAVFDDVSKEKLFIYPHKIEWKNGIIPVAHKADYEALPVDQKEPLKEELKHFASCVLERKSPITDGNEGLKVLKVLDMAERSLSGHKPGISYTIKDSKKYFAHESSFIDDNVEIGQGTKIWHFSHILSGSRIGENCNIGQNVVMGPDVSIGNNCKVQNNVSLYKGVTLEDGVFCGPSMVFTNVYNPRAEIRKMDEARPTLVKKGATIGANATIVCGVTLGRYSFIGAGAVVTKDIPDHALIVGNQGKQIGWMCQCGERLNDTLQCTVCGNVHQKDEKGLKSLRTDELKS